MIHIIFTFLQEFCLVGPALFSFSLIPHLFLDISFIFLIPFYCSAIHEYWKMWMILLCSCLHIQYLIIHRRTASHPTCARLVTQQRRNKYLLFNSSICAKAIFLDSWPFSLAYIELLTGYSYSSKKLLQLLQHLDLHLQMVKQGLHTSSLQLICPYFPVLSYCKLLIFIFTLPYISGSHDTNMHFLGWSLWIYLHHSLFPKILACIVFNIIFSLLSTPMSSKIMFPIINKTA